MEGRYVNELWQLQYQNSLLPAYIDLFVRNRPGDHRLVLPLQFQLSAGRIGKLGRHADIGLFRHEELSRSRGALKACGYIDRISEDGVVLGFSLSHVADEGLAGRYASSNLQPFVFRQFAYPAHNFQRRLHRPAGVLALMDRGAEEGHHLIADQLVQSAIMANDALCRQQVEAVQASSDFSRREPLREGSEAADIHEHDRYDERLPARRSELVSERAEIRVFARWTDLHKAKRNSKKTEKGHKTLFTPLPRREPAVKPARPARAAHVLPEPRNELSYFPFFVSSQRFILSLIVFS